MVEDTAGHVSVPHVQDTLTAVQAKLGPALAALTTRRSDCYLRTHVGLHDLHLLGETLLGHEVAGEVLDGGLTLVTGDGTSGSSDSGQQDTEQLHGGGCEKTVCPVWGLDVFITLLSGHQAEISSRYPKV